MATILYIEDNSDHMLFVKRLLEAHGHRFVWAENGGQALAVAQRLAPDVVLLDLDLPDMDGCELARWFTQHVRRPNGGAIPIVALTANVFTPARRALKAGCGAQLLKPVSLRDLWKQVEAALQ